MRIVHTNINLLGLGDGDGRNDAMFKIVMPLQTAGLSTDDCREVLGLINEYIFEKPLSKSEFETVTRDEAFETKLVPSFFGEKGKFLFEQFAQYLIREYHIKRVNGRLSIYQDGEYVSDELLIQWTMLQVIPDLTARQRNEVLSYINVMCMRDHECASVDYIAFKNGILNIKTKELYPFSPDIVITNKIPWNYRDDAYSEVVDRTFNKMACHDELTRKSMEEAVGYCFYRRNELRKAFILTGEKSNGKSTFIAMIQKCLGQANYASLDLSDVSHQFRSAMLTGKLANLGDDISAEYIRDPSHFKKLVSGEVMTGENKGKDPFQFMNYAKFIFSANDIPRTKDKTGAVKDRLIIIPFNATFSASDPDFDPFIKDKLCSQESIEYMIKLGVDALIGVLGRNKFTVSEQAKDALEEYNKINNPILEFLDDLEENEVTRESVGYWYDKYSAFCLNSYMNPVSRIEFGRLMKKQGWNIVQRRVNGNRERFFTR